MLRKLAVTSLLLVPLLGYAEGRGHGHGHGRHAPEIDGSNVVLAIALLGGVLSLVRRREKR